MPLKLILSTSRTCRLKKCTSIEHNLGWPEIILNKKFSGRNIEQRKPKKGADLNSKRFGIRFKKHYIK